MFGNAIQQKFLENPDDDAVRQQALKLIQLFWESSLRHQILTDIAHAVTVSGRTSTGQNGEIAFAMGLQFGFELALSYPPLKPQT
jgi:hypothetical protein